jgi:hypothetical protein
VKSKRPRKLEAVWKTWIELDTLEEQMHNLALELMVSKEGDVGPSYVRSV